ncbi:hypothetical protein [Pseudooceanicola atlanticus]|uniref:hypothetical protein n=1 Tax=Pseudooceanicola atlanticus TaxID=1461694 RepID=UPI002355C4FB|nr:hypothetical protein [Pseudooceanicola atlanticus]
MKDLLDTIPHPGLADASDQIAGHADPVQALRAAMASGFRFGLAGCDGQFLVFGYGVEGRGPTRAEAVQQWLAGAEATTA